MLKKGKSEETGSENARTERKPQKQVATRQADKSVGKTTVATRGKDGRFLKGSKGKRSK